MVLKIHRYILIAFIVLTPFYSSAQQSKADGLFEAANQWVEKGDAQKAIKGYLNARTEYLKEQNYKRVLTCTQNVAYYYQDIGDVPAAEKLLLETILAIPKSNQEQLSIHASLQDNLAYTYLYAGKMEESIRSYSESIQLYEKAGMSNTSKQGFELVNRASVYYQLSQFDLCADDIKRAIAIYEKDESISPESISECYGTLGNAYREMGKLDDALNALEQAYHLVAKSEGKELQAKYLNDMGIVLAAKDQHTDALVKYKEAAAINEKLFGKDADHYAQNLINLGALYSDMGDLDKAIATFQEVIAIYQQTPPQEASDLTDVLIIMSRITDDLGKFDESQKLLTVAMDLTIASYGENSLMQADMYISLATAAFNRSEFDQSLTYNFKALSILQANKYPESADYAMIYSNVGLAYDELRDIGLALKYKTQALELYKKLYGPVHVSVAKSTGDIGLSYEMLEEYDRAIEYLKKSVDIRLTTQSPMHDDVGTTYLNIGLMYLKLQQPKSGIEFLEKARLIYDPYQRNVNKAMIYNRLGFAYDMLNDKEKAKRYTQQAIIANTFGFDNTDFEVNPQQPDFLDFYELNLSYIQKIDYYTQLGDKLSLLKGEKLLTACDEIIRAKALDIKKEKDRLALSQLNSFYTEAAMLLTDKLYQVTKDPTVLEKAYYYSERSKANELLADIQTSKAVSVSGVPKRLLERRTVLAKRMNTLHQQIASAYGAKNQELITILKSQEFDLTKEYETLQSEISAVAPGFGTLTNQRAIPAWSDLRKTLDGKTAIVSYTITDSAKYILIGTNSRLILKSIPPKTNLEKLVRVYINQIKHQSSVMKQIAGQLTDILWAPVENAFAELGSIEKIIIIPEGPLNYLPFESLGKDRYLLEKYTIRYQFSGALVVKAGQSTEKEKPSLIAMAPVFEDKATNFVNKSCERFVKSSVKVDSTSRAFTLDGQYISPLPATEVEVERINQIHQDKGILSKSFVKENANEELIKKGELATYDYIHFATHGFVNTQYPELSGLLLSQNAKSQEDGILYTGEILGLNVKANLVTLSACETALGKKIEGEGVRGLTTSFLFAGARNVVASLWKVADESTSTLMITFYDELLSGKDKATALRLAKQRLLADEKYKHPFYWAPFIQVGAN